MIYVTGDCHGDYRRFSTGIFPEQKNMGKDDYVIICGDFGYWDESREQKYWLEWLDSKPFTTLWVDGNHENYDLLKKQKVSQWCGGKVQHIMPSVIHLMRGQIYELSGLKIFTFGGAKSHDISGGILEAGDPRLREKRKKLDKKKELYRINHVSWWKEEMPTEDELAEGLRNLIKNDWEVDFIFSHCCATSTQERIADGTYQPDILTRYFDKIKEMCRYKKWFFGHYHDNRSVNNKEILLYEQIIRIH